MPDIFAGSRIKIERANAHINNLIAEIDRFRQTNPYEVFVNDDPTTGYQTVCSRVKRLVPNMWGCIVGDAIHNTRTALDLMVNDLVAPNQRGKARFHIYESPNARWPSGIPSVKGLPDELQAKMVNIQPYNTGDMTLRHLHMLDIEDKHQVLMAVASASAVRNINAKQSGTSGTMHIGEIKINTGETGEKPMGMSVHKSMGMQFDDNFNVSIDIVFGDTDTLPGSSIIPTIKGFVESVESVIADFTPKTTVFYITSPITNI